MPSAASKDNDAELGKGKVTNKSRSRTSLTKVASSAIFEAVGFFFYFHSFSIFGFFGVCFCLLSSAAFLFFCLARIWRLRGGLLPKHHSTLLVGSVLSFISWTSYLYGLFALRPLRFVFLTRIPSISKFVLSLIMKKSARGQNLIFAVSLMLASLICFLLQNPYPSWGRFWSGIGALFVWGILEPQSSRQFKKMQQVHKNKFLGPALAFAFSSMVACILYLLTDKEATDAFHWLFYYPFFFLISFFSVYGPHYFQANTAYLSLFRFLCHLTITATATLVASQSELSFILLCAYSLLLAGHMVAGHFRFSLIPLFAHLPLSWRQRAYGFYKHLFHNQLSRRLFYFLILNVVLMVVEFIAGFKTNSLTMISEACHMGFDCLSLAVGFAALLISKKPPTRTFTFGFSRLTVIAGFVNATCLLFTGVTLFLESIERFIHPPELVISQSLIYLSLSSLLVNLLGAFLLQDHGHGHSHSGHCDHNLRAMYLHCLTDCLGSLGLLVSMVTIHKFGLFWVDPLCSVFIVALIFYSVIPLLFQTGGILASKTPENLLQIEKIFQQLLTEPAILAYRDLHIWQLTSRETYGSIYLKVANFDSAQPAVTKTIRTLKASLKFQEFIIQLETEVDGVKSLNYRYNTL